MGWTGKPVQPIFNGADMGLTHELTQKLLKAGWKIEGDLVHSPEYKHIQVKKIDDTPLHKQIDYALIDIPYVNQYEISMYLDRQDSIYTPKELNEARNTLINRINELIEIAKNDNLSIKLFSEGIMLYNKDKRALINCRTKNTKIQCKSERDTWIQHCRIYSGPTDGIGRSSFINIKDKDKEWANYVDTLTKKLQEIKPTKLLTKEVLPKPHTFVDIHYKGNPHIKNSIRHNGMIYEVSVEKISHLKDDCIFDDAVNDPNCTDLWFICTVCCHTQHNLSFKMAYRPEKGWYMLYRTGRDRITTESIRELNKYDEVLLKKAIDLYIGKEKHEHIQTV
jgi:hypothetical protein